MNTNIIPAFRADGGSYGIASNQHPFVSLLRSFPSTWPHVAAQVRRSLQQENEDKYVIINGDQVQNMC